MGFATKNLMPNHIAAEYDEMTVAYELKLDDEDKYSDQKIFTKVLKLDETVKMDMQWQNH